MCPGLPVESAAVSCLSSCALGTVERMISAGAKLVGIVGFTLTLAGAESQFREPAPVRYQWDATGSTQSNSPEWIRAWRNGNRGRPVEMGARLVLQTDGTIPIRALLGDRPVRVARQIDRQVCILACSDANIAAAEAARLARLRGVVSCHPVMRRLVSWTGPAVPMPSDPWFVAQWYLENRAGEGVVAGADLNVRTAWPWTRGQGVTVAVADCGVEVSHPDLAARTRDAPHFNFSTGLAEGAPWFLTAPWAHGTEVAGLIAATTGNSVGMAGVAPEVRLASWVIRGPDGFLVDDERLMDMYQHRSQEVAIQNHSWVHDGQDLQPVSLAESIGVSNAVHLGRQGRGVIMVRSAGNAREAGENANDDGYLANPEVIGVGAVRADGRVASYSEPGACLLVAAPSGDADSPTMFTTDLTGVNGVNLIQFFPPYQDLNNYVFNNLGFSGTSGSAPLVSGVVALMLSANPKLGWRDMQHILALSSRHMDRADPDLTTNAAGLAVSHNVGFGVPDAGRAVRLALSWSNLPPYTNVVADLSTPADIPDGALRILIFGPGVPVGLASLVCLPGTGVFPDVPTEFLPLEDVGAARTPIGRSLVGKAALIERSGDDYTTPLTNVAAAGAALAIVYNSTNGTTACPGGDALCPLLKTDFVPIPAAFIRQGDGQNLKARLGAGLETLAQYQMDATNLLLDVSAAMICEHVGVRVRTDHPLRGDLRITLVSPGGTRSVLQRLNQDTNAGPLDWTYYSTHHFLEASKGRWTLFVGDQFPGNAGRVISASLMIRGRLITDTDADGLDDTWELRHFGNQVGAPKDDPDHDGYPNAVEQILHANPNARDQAFVLDLSPWNQRLGRLSWPSGPGDSFDIWSATDLGVPLTLTTNVPGRFPEAEWFFVRTNESQRFFRVNARFPSPSLSQ
jgi:subtilisin-like proprotein convertase family protein